MRDDIPAISGAAMAGVDQIMMQELGVDTLQLMELAGYGVADMARRHCGLEIAADPRIVALAGTGGNGGDAMVAARLLQAWGVDTSVVLGTWRNRFSGVAEQQLAMLDRLKIPVYEPDAPLPRADLIIDGLFGFSLHGNPRGEVAELVRDANAHPAPVLAIDVPSGLDATTGEDTYPCIHARWTVTLGLPKIGLLSARPEITGEIWLADIGIPPWAYADIGVTVPGDLFAREGLVCIRQLPG